MEVGKQFLLFRHLDIARETGDRMGQATAQVIKNFEVLPTRLQLQLLNLTIKWYYQVVMKIQ